MLFFFSVNCFQVCKKKKPPVVFRFLVSSWYYQQQCECGRVTHPQGYQPIISSMQLASVSSLFWWFSQTSATAATIFLFSRLGGDKNRTTRHSTKVILCLGCVCQLPTLTYCYIFYMKIQYFIYSLCMTSYLHGISCMIYAYITTYMTSTNNTVYGQMLHDKAHAVFNPCFIRRIQIITSFQQGIKHDVTQLALDQFYSVPRQNTHNTLVQKSSF